LTKFSKKVSKISQINTRSGGGGGTKSFPIFLLEKETKFVGKKKQIISPTHIELTISFQMFQFQIKKPTKKKKKKHKTCNNNAFNRLRNLIVKQQARNPVESKKEERKKKSCEAKALQLIILYLMSEAVLSHTRFS
jgi:hypothetical protein